MTKTDILILIILLAFTSLGTAGLVELVTADNGLPLLIRQFAAVGFTDGVIIYWHTRRNQYKDREQRKWANRMLWASVGVVLFFTLVYGGLSAMGGSEWMNDTMKPLAIAGMEFMVGTPAEITALFVDIVLGAQAAGTLAAILYIAQIDPETLKALQQKEAEEAIAKQQATDYKTAQQAIAPLVGQAQALNALREQLTAMGYNEKEREKMVSHALQTIQSGQAQEADKVTPSAGMVSLHGVTPLEVGQPVPFSGNGHKR